MSALHFTACSALALLACILRSFRSVVLEYLAAATPSEVVCFSPVHRSRSVLLLLDEPREKNFQLLHGNFRIPQSLWRVQLDPVRSSSPLAVAKALQNIACALTNGFLSGLSSKLTLTRLTFHFEGLVRQILFLPFLGSQSPPLCLCLFRTTDRPWFFSTTGLLSEPNQ